MKNFRTTLKDFYSFDKYDQEYIREKIQTISKKHFDAGDSISVCIKKTYFETEYTFQLCDAIVRSSSLMSNYEKRHKLKRGLSKFNFNKKQFLDAAGFEIP